MLPSPESASPSPKNTSDSPSAGVRMSRSGRLPASICAEQGPRAGMPFAFGPLEMRVEDALRQLCIAGMAGVAGVGQRDAQRALVVLGDALVGGARLRGAAGDIGNQGAMIAQEVRRPIRQLLAVQEIERLLGLVLRLINPGARQRARQFADRMAARLLEMIFGFLVAALLEGRRAPGMRGRCGGRAVPATSLRASVSTRGQLPSLASIWNAYSTSTSLSGSCCSALP